MDSFIQHTAWRCLQQLASLVLASRTPALTVRGCKGLPIRQVMRWRHALAAHVADMQAKGGKGTLAPEDTEDSSECTVAPGCSTQSSLLADVLQDAVCQPPCVKPSSPQPEVVGHYCASRRPAYSTGVPQALHVQKGDICKAALSNLRAVCRCGLRPPRCPGQPVLPRQSLPQAFCSPLCSNPRELCQSALSAKVQQCLLLAVTSLQMRQCRLFGRVWCAIQAVTVNMQGASLKSHCLQAGGIQRFVWCSTVSTWTSMGCCNFALLRMALACRISAHIGCESSGPAD